MNIIVSDEYTQDRKKITTRIKNDGYYDRSRRITNGFKDSATRVKFNPTSYSLVQTFRNKKKYWRIARYKTWNIFFIYNKLKNELVFARIIHQHRSTSTIYKQTKHFRDTIGTLST